MILTLRTSIKLIVYKKFFFTIMLCLLTATLFLLSTFTYLFITSYGSLKDIKSSFPVTVTTQINNDVIEHSNPELLKDSYNLLLNSNYFNTINSNLYLSGRLSSYQRLPHAAYGERKLEDQYIFYGIVQSIKQDTNEYVLNIKVTNSLFCVLDIHSKYTFELQSKHTLSQLDPLIGQELYLEGYKNHLINILNPTYIESPIFVENNMEDTIQLQDYYKYMYNLQSLKSDEYTYPILLTQNLDTYEPFANNTYHIVNGTSFTDSDYINPNVCLISSELANKHNFNIGDTIDINKIETPMSYQLTSPHYFTPAQFIDEYQYVSLNYQSLSSLKVSDALNSEGSLGNQQFIDKLLVNFRETYNSYISDYESTYKIIGLYDKVNLNTDLYYALNPNTIIVATDKIIPIDSFDESIYPHLNTNSFSYTFTNPDDKDNFYTYLLSNNFDFSKYNLNIIDNGYYQLSNILLSMQNSSFILLIISGVAFLMILILFLYFYFESCKKIFALNRILGSSTLESILSCCSSSHLIYILATFFTLIMNYKFTQKIYNILYTNSLNRFTISPLDNAGYSNLLNYKWNLTYYISTSIILFTLYLLGYFIFYHLYFKKSLIRLVKK